jgi:pimeloyl-ACP methyl ester carboxylesterase
MGGVTRTLIRRPLAKVSPWTAVVASLVFATSSAGATPGASPGAIDGLFDVGDGRRLYLNCEGTGSPTIVYLHGAGGPSSNAGVIPSLLRDDYRFCVYDRANVGRSDRAEGPRTAADSVADLHTLLAAAEVPGPHVLLGASRGGAIAYTYAGTHPDDVAGLVLLDPDLPGTNSWILEYLDEEFLLPEEELQAMWRDDPELTDEIIRSMKDLDAAAENVPAVPAILFVPPQAELGPEFGEGAAEAYLELQQDAMGRFNPGEVRVVDSPHYMEPVIPDEIAAAVREVIGASSATQSAPGPVVAESMEPEPALEMAWEAAAPTGALTWGIGIDTEGRIWVTASDGTFLIYDRDGNLVETWGTPGTAEGEFTFTNPDGPFGDVVFRADGGFYVADAGNVRVQEFDADRQFVRAWGSFGTEDGQFVSPSQIDIDGAGNVYVLDNSRSDVQVFDPEGTFLRVAVSGTGGAVGPFLAVVPEGILYNVDERTRTLNRIGPDGTPSGIATLESLLAFATGIALGPDGRMFVASEASATVVVGPENLVELDQDGNVLHLWPNGGWEIAIDPAGDRVYMPVPFGPNPAAVRAFVLPAQ